MRKISKDVLEKIKKENIKPIPKWEFLLKDTFVWVLFVLNIFFGSIGFAIVLYLLTNNEVISDISLTRGIFQWIFFSIPIVWILLTAMFVFIAYYNFKNTQEGYRFTTYKIFIVNLLITLILGLVLYGSGFSERLNTIFSNHIPFYNKTFDTRSQVWMRPEQGYLAGEIVSIDFESKTIVLMDFNGKSWIVSYSEAAIRHSIQLEIGQRIKMIGIASNDNTFEASEIRPWQGMGRMMQEN